MQFLSNFTFPLCMYIKNVNKMLLIGIVIEGKGFYVSAIWPCNLLVPNRKVQKNKVAKFSKTICISRSPFWRVELLLILK